VQEERKEVRKGGRKEYDRNGGRNVKRRKEGRQVGM
jgi:hypothetical protein